MKRIKFVIPRMKNEFKYIGFNALQSNAIFVFPCKYFKLENEVVDYNKQDVNLYDYCKIEAKKILEIIARCKTELSFGDCSGEHFAFNSLIWLIQDYLNNGLYKEKKVEIKPLTKGKIYWGKTLKTNNLMAYDDYFVFKKFFRHKQDLEENQIITEIYKCCLTYAVKNLGWLYDLYNIEKSIFDIENIEQKELMIAFLKQKLTNNFLDYKTQLFNHLLNILLSVENGLLNDYFSATDSEFEYVFEKLINNVFGTENVKDFYPHANYCINNKYYNSSKLRPDTIMKIEDESQQKSCLVILDAKYYAYGYDGEVRHLPSSSDVIKQVAYAEYILHNKLLKNADSVNQNLSLYSAFILPYLADDNPISGIGYAIDNDSNQQNKKDYGGIYLDSRVYALLVDLKTLVDVNDNSNETKQKRLKSILLDEIIKISQR